MTQIFTGQRPRVAPSTTRQLRPVLFVLFFLSGFCSLLYQVVWTRLAFAHFGVITPVLSVVLSVFMLGLGIGSVLGGKTALWWRRGLNASPAYAYGGAELIIGMGAFVVPVLFAMGEGFLLRVGETSSAGYLFVSALFIVAAILPWCTMMGATFPLMMAFIRETDPTYRDSFGFLYLANVMGAMAGTVLTALVLVELFGLRDTSRIAALCNFSIAAASFGFARSSSSTSVEPASMRSEITASQQSGTFCFIDLVLFTTGFTSLAMEVVWTRAFTFVLTTTIYAFASILATYLLATWIGSYLYRRGLRNGWLFSTEALLGALCLFALLPIILGDPRLQSNAAATLTSIVPICLALGYLTPRLIDTYSKGDPARAGRAYGMNIAGGILGPLFAGYILLPTVGTRAALIVLSAPLVVLFAGAAVMASTRPRHELKIVMAYAALFVFSLMASRGVEDGEFYQDPHEIRRDQVASVAADGTGMDKRLLVNGYGVTTLTPITKVMAHLPLAMNGRAKSGLVICFGMGTTFRAMHAWGIETTAVDLSRSVTESFSFFFPDAQDLFRDPKAHIVVDDGRRYLLRTNKTFEVIAIDPPPPIEAAASSLLYTTEFYDVVKKRLAPGGILQQWFPGGDDKAQDAVERSLRETFPNVVAFKSIGPWGYHYLASLSPIPEMNPAEFVAVLPQAARRDLMEWNTELTIEQMAKNILSERTDISSLLSRNDTGAMVTDDRPYNEYYIMRRHHWIN